MQQQTSDNQLLALIKQFNPLASAKIIKNSQRQLKATEELVAKIDKLVGIYKDRNLQKRGIIGGAINDRKDYLKQFMNVDSILRRMILPIPGTITANIIDAMEERRLFKTEKKEQKKQFERNFFESTALGRTVDPKSKKGKDLVKKEWDRFESLNTMKEEKEADIARKKKNAEMFGGMGGPSKKDLEELKRINNTIQANTIRVTKGKAAEADFLAGKTPGIGLPGKEGQQQAEDSAEVVKTLKLIEINTRPDRFGADDIEKERESILRPHTGMNGKVEVINEKDLDGVNGPDEMFGGIFSRLKNIIGAIFSPKAILRAITKVFAPAMIIASIATGVMDGFKEFQKSGSIKEALIAGFGGILEFITFGLLDKESLTGFIDFVTEGVSKVVDKVKDLVTGPINWIVDNITALYSSIVDTAKSIISKAKKFIGLGEDVKDEIILPDADKKSDKASIEKAKQEYKTANVKEKKDIEKTTGMTKKELSSPKSDPKPAPIKKSAESNEALAMKEKRLEIDKLKTQSENKKSGDTNTVVAPVVNTSSTTNVHQKAPVRNTEASFNRYLKN